MTRILTITTLAALVLTGCGQSSPAVRRDAAGRDSADLWPERGVVMADSVVPKLLSQCSRGAPPAAEVQGVWAPTPAQIRELEAGLAPLLRKVIARRPYRAPVLAAHLSTYHRQYGGLVLKGRKIIYVNGFARFVVEARGRDTMAWRQYPPNACDGGLVFFGVEYDPATKRFRNLQFNEAV